MLTLTKEHGLHFEGEDWFMAAEELDADLCEALKDCGAPGDAEPAVAYVMANWPISGDPETCRAYLRGFGAWEEDQLQYHVANLSRLVWLAGCDLRESGEAHFCTY